MAREITANEMNDSPVEQLSSMQEWVVVGRDVRLGPSMSALVDWLDTRFVALATEAGVTSIEVPQLIERSVLERAGYFESFSTAVVEDPAGQCMTPATCYHCYARLAASSPAESKMWTCVARCVRCEEKEEVGRLQTFTMREIVLAGSEAWVRERRQEWIDLVLAFARSISMTVALETASDPFFAGGEARGRRLLQQVKQLKYELRAIVDGQGGGLAISSFNLHETFFSRRFGFTLANGTDAYSGCVAFGLERWALALALALGPQAAFNLAAQERQ
jgi:seryl-tRNA synthetase